MKYQSRKKMLKIKAYRGQRKVDARDHMNNLGEVDINLSLSKSNKIRR